MTKCNECGICRTVCPVYKILLRETVSPRGKEILKKKNILDKVFYICTLCNRCEKICPIKVKLKFLAQRAKLVSKGITTTINIRINQNLRKYGTPFPKDS